MGQVRGEGRRSGKMTLIKSPGGLAQLARAPALQAGGHRFDSDILHHPNGRRPFKDNGPAEDCEAIRSREGDKFFK
jgi:hypothetical protein